MSIDSLVWLFIGSFVSWVVLGLVYTFHVEERKPARKVPVVRLIVRVRVRHMAPDDFYQGCYQSLLNALSKEAKDNL